MPGVACGDDFRDIAMPARRRAPKLRCALLFITALVVLSLGTCTERQRELVLATTTSVYDTGLLESVLPAFEQRYGVRVKVLAVGTGQAFELARRGDADVLLVHDPPGEQAFLDEGYAELRLEVMRNDFVIVGPRDDPAGIQGMLRAVDALRAIAQRGATFLSRGDGSGTHRREQALWAKAGIAPAGSWYLPVGQGMGDTLILADEKRAYTLTDRGTFLAMKDRLPDLEILVGGNSFAENSDADLLNIYSAIPLSRLHSQAQVQLARTFAEYLVSPEVQAEIARFGVERYGQPLFYPMALGATSGP